MNRVKMLVKMLNFGSFMILMTAIGVAIRRCISWLKGLATPLAVAR